MLRIMTVFVKSEGGGGGIHECLAEDTGSTTAQLFCVTATAGLLLPLGVLGYC